MCTFLYAFPHFVNAIKHINKILNALTGLDKCVYAIIGVGEYMNLHKVMMIMH